MSRRSSYQENGSTLNSKDVTSVCKAVFLSAYDDIADVIESKKSLFSLLQQTGRNPSKSRMNDYWPSHMEQLTFDDFVQICKKEPVTTVDDLMNAFRKIDLNGDGYLSLDELYKIMNKGDQTMSRDEVRKLIDDVDDNKDGKLDYREFTNMMMKTAEESVKLATKVMQRKEKKKQREERRKDESISDSRTSLRSDDVPRPSPRARASKTKSPSTRSRDKLLDPSELKDWQHYTSKGCFFYEEEEIVSHVYSLKLYETSNVYLTAKPIDEPACLKLPSTEPVDTALFVLDDRGKLVNYTELRDVAGMFAVQCELKAGEYQVVPYTTGCRFKQRPADQDHQKEAKLVKKDKDDNVVITSAFRQALVDIFELCDLDKNGTLSRDEFNWFNLRTSGETLDEDEWEVVEERTPLENGEITKAGFIALNEMEAEDVKGDVEDLWITLSSMGMNKALIMDEACPFQVNVYVEQARKKPSFQVTGIESLKKEEFAGEICQNVIAKAGDPTKIKGMKDLYLYTYRNDFWATVVVDNKSRSTVNLSVDCSRSRNVVSNQPELNHTLEVDPQSAVVAHHLMPRSELSEWSIACTESIHK